MSQQFKDKCIKVAESLGIDIMFFQDFDSRDPFEDDGILHVTQQGLRACFDIASTLRYQFNANVKEVLTNLGMPEKITDDLLVLDHEVLEDEDDEYVKYDREHDSYGVDHEVFEDEDEDYEYE